MKKLKGYNFILKEGDYISLRRKEHQQVSYVGVVRNYDGVSSKSGVLKKLYIYNHLLGEIIEIDDMGVFAWYKKGYIVLKDLETGKYDGLLNDFVDLYKMNKKDIIEFKGKITKSKILKQLK